MSITYKPHLRAGIQFNQLYLGITSIIYSLGCKTELRWN